MSAPKTDGFVCQNPKCAGRSTSPANCHGQPMVGYVRNSSSDKATDTWLDAMVSMAYFNSKNGRVK